MKICTFFGHKNSPDAIYDRLKTTIIDLIEKQNIKTFLVGNNGLFDVLVQRALKEISKKYEIKYNVVLAYLPKDANIPENSILPDGFENFPPRFAIDRRNEYMLNKSDYIICYVTHYLGGSGKFVEMAVKKNKTVINLA